MDETKQLAAEQVVEETTQTSSPEVKAPETQEQTEQTQQNVEPDLPNDETEARRAFQEQRLANKQLKEELEQLRNERQQEPSSFDSFRGQTQPAGPVDINHFTDQITGEVNWGAYNNAINTNAQQVAAQQARQAVSEQLDEYQARSKYPEVFSDKKAEKQIAALYLFERLNGRNVTIEQLAGEVARGTNKSLEKAAQQGAEKAITELTPKEQASLSAIGTTSAPARQAQSAQDDLSRRLTIRQGGRSADDALAAALRAQRS